jgi:hypothetical protein
VTRGQPVVVFGIAFLYPMAGVTWQFLHFLVGLRRLGFDPYYVEDSSRWVYDLALADFTPDPARNIAAVLPALEAHGFGDRWASRVHALDGRCYGLDESRLRAVFREAAAMLNVTGAQEVREDHLAGAARRLYVETDPVATQIGVAEGDAKAMEQLSAHDVLFSYGENFGRPDCGVPLERFTWLPMRQPVVLDFWPPAPPTAGAAYTTIATWRHQKDRVFRGETYYWSKEREFLKILDLPRRTPAPIELALDITPDAPDTEPRLASHGWRVVPAAGVSGDVTTYRDYIRHSRGEFTVAKDQNVRLRSGWFSDRSATYLAAGRPVVTQETAFSNILPSGRGLFGWSDLDDIVSAFDAIERDWQGHARAAREIAAAYFDAETVLRSMLERAGVSVP